MIYFSLVGWKFSLIALILSLNFLGFTIFAHCKGFGYLKNFALGN